MTTSDGARFRKVFDDVWNQLHRLQTHWTIYLCLYGTRSSLELMRATAFVTFGALQDLLTLAIFLETHRLLDNDSTKGHRTASIESLLHDLPPSSGALRRRLQRELKTVRADCRRIEEWRHRHIAHRDAATVLGERIPPLQPVNMRSVGRAIEYVACALTAISDECGLDRSYDVHREMADVDVHKLLERLRTTG